MPLTVLASDALPRLAIEPPRPLTALVGREQATAHVVGLLTDPSTRLVTLTGRGEIGKTRLAIAAFTDSLDHFPDGAAYVPLAAVRDPALIGPSLVQALGGESHESPAVWLRAILADRRLLLFLDNLEQFGDRVTFFSDLLADCPDLAILATSRTRLALSGETVVTVRPLAVPSSELPPAAIAETSTVRLVLARARAVGVDFTLDTSTAPVVAEICRRVDDLPLGLELAATQLRVLQPTAILARIEQHLPLPVEAPRDAPSRHRSLDAVVASSYDALSPDEQRVVRRLAVFVGGFDPTAAAAVVASSEFRVARAEGRARSSVGAGGQASSGDGVHIPVGSMTDARRVRHQASSGS